MVQIVREGSIELLTELKSENYWQRNKKPKVDLLHDTPFAIDRQLEDQRLLIEKNRNPQLNSFTKVDKLRSDKISAQTGAARAVAMKANVVNKIVREASGIHTYTIVPPPKSLTNSIDQKSGGKEILQSETNPRVRPYANESKTKPVLVSFGHRPKSASRTFHPSTMKFRLKHGEILPSTNFHQKSGGIGLPVAVLAKVLHAPPITKLEDVLSKPATADSEVEEDYYRSPMNGSQYRGVNLEESTQTTANSNKSSFDYEGLFFTKEQQAEMLYNIKRHESVYGVHKKKKNGIKLQPLHHHSHKHSLQQELQEDSWITSGSNPNVKISKSTVSLLPPINHDDRDPWDEAFHRKLLSPNHAFKLKQSGINVKQDKPLSELLHRFSTLTIAENQLHPFCQDKQQLDIIQRSGIVSEVPKSIPVKGQPLYTDPWDVNVAVIKRHHKQLQKQKQEQLEAKKYQELLTTIPKVDYYPTTKLKEIQFARQLQMIDQQLAAMNNSSATYDDGTLTNAEETQRQEDIDHLLLQKQQVIEQFYYQQTSEGEESERQSPVRGVEHTLPPYSETITPTKLNNLQYSEEFDPNIYPTARTASAASVGNINTARSIERTFSASLPSSRAKGRDYMAEIEREYPNWANAELESQQSLYLAKKGDTNILYQMNVGKYLDEYQIKNQILTSSGNLQLLPSMESPHLSRATSPKSQLVLLARPLSPAAENQPE